jgi:hypothetical protein
MGPIGAKRKTPRMQSDDLDSNAPEGLSVVGHIFYEQIDLAIPLNND